MPIAKYRHEMKTLSGKPVFLIKTKNPVNRKFLGRTFIDGETHTTNEELAKRFLEEFEYTVVLPSGHPGILLAEAATVNRGEDYAPESDTFLLDDEDEDGNAILADD